MEKLAEFEVTKFKQKSNTIQATVDLDYSYISIGFNEVFSPELKVTDLAAFQIRCRFIWSEKCRCLGGSVLSVVYPHKTYCILSIKFKKSYESDLLYAVYIKESPAPVTTKMFTCNDTWHDIYETNMKKVKLDITVRMDIAPSPTPFAPLHEDKSLTDLELQGDDGSVWVHRAVLAAVSPVFKTEFNNSSNGEVKEYHIDMSEYSSATLQLFKDYVYKNDLTVGFDELLCLASFYEMPELELKCIYQIILNLNGKNFWSMLKLALREKNTKLILAILECIELGGLTVNQIAQHVILD